MIGEVAGSSKAPFASENGPLLFDVALLLLRFMAVCLDSNKAVCKARFEWNKTQVMELEFKKEKEKKKKKNLFRW